MTQSILLGSALGLFSGIVPGPFSALVAAIALERGFRASARIALVPLLSETTVMVIAALFLSGLPESVLRWMGIGGGMLVFYLAHRIWRQSRRPPQEKPVAGSRQRFFEGALLAVLSPAPWVFWLLVGAPLVLNAWQDGWGPAFALFGSFIFFCVGVYLGIAATAASGGRWLDPVWHRRLTLTVAGVMLIAGAALVWQSWIGNFNQMVSGSETVREIVDEP